MKKKIQYNRIKAVMAEKGVKNIDVAKGVKVTTTTVSRWCTNDRQPDVPMLFKIAKFLRVNAGTLLVKNLEEE